MASKVAKKKPAKKSVTASSVISSAAPSATKSGPASSVIPFNPLGSMASANMCNFNQTAPAFSGIFESFESMESMMTNYKDQYETTTAALRQNIEACTKTSATFTKGAEQMFKMMSEMAQETAQRNSEAVKSLMASRTLNEYAEAQNKLVQENFDEAMSAATKLSEMTIKLYTEAFEPLNGQMTKAMKKASESMAA